MRFALTLLASVLAIPSLIAASDPGRAKDDYQMMQKWMFSATAVTIPASGVTFRRDTTTWTLTSGEVRLIRPASDGTITGFVFEGEGRFRMTIPDPVERAQLSRFTRSTADVIDQPFRQMVARFSDDTVNRLFGKPAGDSYAPSALAQKVHESWLIDLGYDVDARVVAAMLNASALQITAAMKTADFDWLTYDYDSCRREEISLIRTRGRIPEVWISLDRPEDRRPDGRPGDVASQTVRLDHIEVKADLSKWSFRDQNIGISNQRTVQGRYVVTERLMPLRDGIAALRLTLNPKARDLTVTENDMLVPFLRDAIGKRSATLENDISDEAVTLLLRAPLQKGVPQEIRFEYTLETANYALGGMWYPTVPDDLEHGHTARLELTVDKRHELRAMGTLESEHVEEKRRTLIWVVSRPTRMITFATADHFEEVHVPIAGIPEIVAFGPSFQFQNQTKMRNVAADVANSFQFFQNLFQMPIAGEKLYVTSIAAGHGQAFDGFLHLSEGTFTGEHPGASELFRAHEVAHEWWGHRVGWKTYRDQWLSEAFAEYSAMLFVDAFVPGGKKYFDEILTSYEGIINGQPLRGGFSKFNRPWLANTLSFARERLGPIALGARAATSEIPAGYVIQTYHKGPLVLHMLRMLLLYKTGNDDLFVKILRDFAHELDGKAATTDDFRRIVERDAPGDWRFFFDVWVDGASLPSYDWSYRIDPDGQAFKLSLTVRRRDISDGPLIIIPVRIDYGNGRIGVFFVKSDRGEQTIVQKLPRKPVSVTFAPNHSMIGPIHRN